MKEQFVTHEIAMQLKNLGFDEECFGRYFKQEFKVHIQFENVTKFYTNKRILELEVRNPDMSKDQCIAPLWQQAIDFILIKYGLSIEFNVCNDCKFHYEILSWDNEFYNGSICIDSKDRNEFYNSLPFENKYIAREQAILKAIELCQKKK